MYLLRSLTLALLAFYSQGFMPHNIQRKTVPMVLHASCKSFNSNNNEIQPVHLFEPDNAVNEDTKCLLFFSGGNSIISHEVYSIFLGKLSSKNYAIYSVPFNYKDFDELLDILQDKYKEIIPISHSSGSVSLVNKVANKNYIHRAIMLDPIDARIDRTQNIKLKYLKNILLVRAEKSYQSKFIPFIPDFLALTKDKLVTTSDCVVKTVIADNYGHCDLLNPMYSNIVHKFFNFICDSSPSRELKHLYGYIDWLVITINQYIQGDGNGDSGVDKDNTSHANAYLNPYMGDESTDTNEIKPHYVDKTNLIVSYNDIFSEMT